MTPAKKHKPLSPLYQSPCTLMDVDPEQQAIYTRYSQITDIPIPSPLITGDEPWKKQDRDYFFDHPYAIYYNRAADDEERQHVFEVLMRMQNFPIQPNWEQDKKFFRSTMVVSISPGCRIRLEIDSLERKPEQLAVYIGRLNYPFPGRIFKPLQEFLEFVWSGWSHALRMPERGDLDAPQ